MRKIDANVSSESLGVSAIDFKSQTQTVTVIQIPNTYSLVFYFYCILFFDFEPKPVLRKQENSWKKSTHSLCVVSIVGFVDNSNKRQ